MTTRRWLMVALAAVAILLIAGRSLAGLYADYLWYDSLGAIALWKMRVETVALLRIASAIVAGAFAFGNLYAVRQSVVSLVFPRRVGNLEIGEEVPGRYLMGAALALAVVLGVLLAVPQDDWISFVLARSGRAFLDTEGFFDRDLGFYVYWLPFESALWSWAFATVIVVSVTVVLLYALTPSLKWQRGGFQATAYVRRHCTVLVGILLLLLAWSFRLDMFSLLANGSGPEGAFTYVDHHVGILGDLILALATLGAALVVLWAGFVGQLRLASVAVLTIVGLALLVREAVPAIAEHTGSDAQRLARERDYVGTRAQYTRRAFDVGSISRLDLPGDSSMVYPTLTAALPWVPVWDPPALSRSIEAGRMGDEYSAPPGWRSLPTGMVADVIDPPPPGAAPRAPWTVARVLASDADDRGVPIRVGGPVTAIDDSPLEQPLVYPGASPYTIVADSLNHTAGTPLDSFLARLATAWSLQNFRILSGDLAQPRPTIIMHRDVRDRVDRVAPFFAQGRTVNPLVVGDTLYWGLDLYSVSDAYPLSRHAFIMGAERSYWRHAAVAIVQASTGEVVVVPDTSTMLDPVASTWVHLLPSIFGSWAGLSAVRRMLPPRVDGLYAQANAFGRFGTSTNADSARHVPTVDGADSALVFDAANNAMSPDDLPFALPRSPVTALALPLVDETDRIRGLLIGLGGATPERSTLWYPLRAPGPRWSVVLEQLRSLDSAGIVAREGPLAHGRVRPVPLRSGIAYLQPVYRWRPQSVPSLVRVAMLDGDSMRSVAPPTGAAAEATAPAQIAVPRGDLRGTVTALYQSMRDALKRGDWSAFGRAFDALGRALAQPAHP